MRKKVSGEDIGDLTLDDDDDDMPVPRRPASAPKLGEAGMA